jgi:pantetheine-phosphate adenylyltransferase
MTKIAVFPGTFDPFTKGHQSVVQKVLPLFDKLIIAIGYNSSKSGFFPLKKRMAWIEKVYSEEPKVSVVAYDILTVDFCKQENASYIIRGLRSGTDFEYEQQIAQVNKQMDASIETIFVLTEAKYAAISSSIVREVYRFGKDVSEFIPEEYKIENV